MIGIIVLFIFAVGIQIVFYTFVFSRLAYYTPNRKKQRLPEDLPPVSVIICAKNEAENLSQNLSFVLRQTYPHFEVIVVDDASVDQTGEVLSRFQKQYSHLRIVSVAGSESGSSGKKYALTKGITSALYDVLVLTDADCRPAGSLWLQTMAEHFCKSPHTDIVLGYGPYRSTSGLLNKLIQYETIYTAMHYLSFALWGQPYMGVGRNMAYKKSLFYRVNGFANHEKVLSGDDDLFINQVAKGKNTVIEINRNAFCYSSPSETWAAWYQQKKRHFSTAKYYKTRHKILLALSSVSHFLYYTTGLILLYFKLIIPVILVTTAFRIIVQLLVFKQLFNKHFIADKNYWCYPLFVDFIYIVYYCVFAPSLFLHNNIKWKQ